MDHKSQNSKILAILQSGRSLTPLSALRLVGSWRLSGRIEELRKAGWPIVTDMVSRNGKRFASYKLAEKS